MTPLLPLLVLSLLVPAGYALAQDEGTRAPQVLIIDKDPAGTNVRSAPSGKVLSVVPYQGRAGVRIVSLSEQASDWFRVEADGVGGWMHASVLGTCAAATEDGDPGLSKSPTNDSATSGRIAAGSPVKLLGVSGSWLKVRGVDAKGRTAEGWLPEQAQAASENELAACAKAWAAR
jgi:SH3-like domain-containing protein